MKALYSGLLLIFWTSLAYAQYRFNVTTSLQYFKLGLESQTQYSSESLPIILKPNAKIKLNESHRFIFDPLLRYDLKTVEPTEKFQTSAQDFYYEYSYAASKVRLGYQAINWEGTDFSNPLDFVMQKNLTDPLDQFLITSPGLGYLYDGGNLIFDFYYIPKMTPSHLPGPKNPWLPRKTSLHLETSDYRLLLPTTPNYEILSPEELAGARDHNFAGRLQYKSSQLESTLAYYSGLANSPFVLMDLNTNLVSLNPLTLQLNNPLQLRPFYYRNQALGVLFTAPFNGHMFRLSGNAILPQKGDSRLPGFSAQQVLGWEKNFDFKSGPLTAIIQYHQSQSAQSGQLSFLQNIFTQAFSMGSRISISDESSMLAGMVIDLKGQSHLTKIEWTKRIKEIYEIGLNLTELGGPESSLLGVYNSYDRYGIKLTGYF